MNRFLLPLLGLACWLSAGTVQAALSDPAQIQTEAYVNLVQADQGLDAGRLDEALSLYQAARGYYQQLAQDFPSWEPRIVQYRKTYCDNQLMDIERRMNGDMPVDAPELAPLPIPKPAPQPEPVVVVEPEPSRDARERSVEVDYLKSRINSLESQLSEMDVIQSEVDTLNSEHAKLLEDLEAARQQLADQADTERTALSSLRAELAAKEETLQSLQRDVEAKKQLDQVLNDMEAKVNELRSDNALLKKEIQTLDAELDATENRASKAEKSADKARQATEKAEAQLKDSGDFAKQLKKADAQLIKSELRVTQLEKSDTKLKDVETRAKKAEKELSQARSDLADAEKELSAAKQKPSTQQTDRSKEKTEPKAKPVDKKKAESKAKPKKAEQSPVSEPFMATVPPKSIPRGTAPADYVRQLLQAGENDTALATVQQARRSQPADMNLILIEGISLIRLQRYEEAATMMIDLAKNNPRNAEVHATLGAAMMGAGFYDEARETLLMAAKLDKNLPECQYNLAQLYAFIDPISIKKARKYYKLALDLGLPPNTHLEKALK